MRTRPKACALALLFALATSAQAKIGETPDQIIARSQRDKDIIAIHAGEFGGKPTLEVVYPDGSTVTHVFGREGRQIAMCSYVPKRLTDKDVVKIQGLYKTTWRGTGTEDGLFSWESDNGLFMTAKRYQEYDLLWIFDKNKPAELRSILESIQQEIAPKAVPTPKRNEFDFVPENPPPGSMSNDCLIVATEAYKRLKPTSHWARIASFSWTKAAKEMGGHAVVFFQPTPSATVFMYDKDGSWDLAIQSHDLNEIAAALNQKLHNATDLAVQNTKWVGAE